MIAAESTRPDGKARHTGFAACAGQPQTLIDEGAAILMPVNGTEPLKDEWETLLDVQTPTEADAKAPAFCSGTGQHHTNEADTNKPDKTLTPYNAITFVEIQAMCDKPKSVPKAKAEWFIPSTLLSRSFAAQGAQGSYGCLAADLDTDPTPLNHVASSMAGVLSGANFEVYSSHSATEAKQKGRVLVPLAKQLTPDDWRDAQAVFFNKLKSAGHECDRALLRFGQLVYLPNRGSWYFSTNKRNAGNFEPMSTWAAEIEAERAERIGAEQAATAAKVAREARARQFPGKPTTLDHFNATTNISEILQHNGYKESPNRPGNWRHPNSETGNYSLQVLENGMAYGLSSSDPLGGAQNEDHAVSPFDALMKLEHAGNFAAAFEAVTGSPPREKVSDAASDFAADAGDDEVDAPTPLRLPKPFPGAHADMVAAILSASHVPQTDLAFMCALVGMSACIPNNYSFTDGTRLNLYGAGLAESTEGKEAGPNAIEVMCREFGINVVSRPASGEALEDQIAGASPILCNIREAGHVFAVLAGKNPAPQAISLVATLLDSFSMSSRTFTPRAKANIGVKPAVPNPILALMMMSTPGKMRASLTEDNISDGLLGRILLAAGNTDGTLNHDAAKFVLPASAGPLSQLSSAGSTFAGHIVWTPDTDRYQRELMGQWFAKKRALQTSEDLITAALIGRRGEKFKRICGIVAVWATPDHPTITMEMAKWAEEVIVASDALMCAFVENGLGSDDQSVMDGNRVLSSMRKIKAHTVKGRLIGQEHIIEQGKIPRSLTQDNARLGPDRFDKAIKYLVSVGRISEAEYIYSVGGKERKGAVLAFIGRAGR